MSAPQFVDLSGFQPADIDWATYRKWSAQSDGISRVAIKATEGVGFIDPHFQLYRQAAIDAGIDVLLLYHFARPDLGNSASSEANFMHSVVGNVRDSDILVLDYEVASPKSTAEWAYEWLIQQKANYGKNPAIYASASYIQENLQMNALSPFKLWLANWQFTPDERPPVPKPWTNYEFVQYTDRATSIPGIGGTVDANIFLGGNTSMATTIPTNWTDDGTTLKSPDGTPVVLGFRDHVLNNSWDPANVPLEAEHHDIILEQSNNSLGAGQSQMFRWKRLEYTPKTGVFEGWLGQELLWYQKNYAQLLKKVGDLQQQLNKDTQAQEIAQLQAENAQLKALLASSNIAQIGTLIKQIADDAALIVKLAQVE